MPQIQIKDALGNVQTAAKVTNTGRTSPDERLGAQQWLAGQAIVVLAEQLDYKIEQPDLDLGTVLESLIASQPMYSSNQRSILSELLDLVESTGIDTSKSRKLIDDKEDQDEMSDKELDNMIDNLSFEDYVNHAYEDDELAVIDQDTGERLDHDENVDEQTNALNEVLSRMERVRARSRMAKTKTKRMAKEKIALKKRSSTEVINRRARRMAVKAMEKRLARNKPLESLSVPEKERIERIIARRKAVISRLAMKIVPHVRAIEKDRLQHIQFTKPSDK